MLIYMYTSRTHMILYERTSRIFWTLGRAPAARSRVRDGRQVSASRTKHVPPRVCAVFRSARPSVPRAHNNGTVLDRAPNVVSSDLCFGHRRSISSFDSIYKNIRDKSPTAPKKISKYSVTRFRPQKRVPFNRWLFCAKLTCANTFNDFT